MAKCHSKKRCQNNSIDHTMQSQSLVVVQVRKRRLMYDTRPVNRLHEPMINTDG